MSGKRLYFIKDFVFPVDYQSLQELGKMQSNENTRDHQKLQRPQPRAKKTYLDVLSTIESDAFGAT